VLMLNNAKKANEFKTLILILINNTLCVFGYLCE